MLDRPPFFDQFHRTQQTFVTSKSSKLDYCYLSRTRFYSSEDEIAPAGVPCDHYIYNVDTLVSTPEPNNTQAVQKLQDAVTLNLLSIYIPLNSTLGITYTATEVTADLSPGSDIDTGYRERFYTQYPDWSSVRIRGDANKRTIKGISLSDCRIQCLQANSFECESFSQCHSECIMSDKHGFDVMSTTLYWIVDSACTLYSRYYTDTYVKSPGKVLPAESDQITYNVNGVQECARNCTADGSCKSFEYCPSLRECAYHQTHVSDVPVEDLRDKIGCDHYSKNYFSDFEVVGSKEYELRDAEVFMDLTVVDCAKYCVDETKFMCTHFLYCPTDGTDYCLLPSSQATGQSTPIDKAVCTEYKRVYFPNGDAFTTPTPSTDETSYTAGDVAGVAIGLLLVGVLLCLGVLVAVAKIRGRPVTDGLNLRIVTNEE